MTQAAVKVTQLVAVDAIHCHTGLQFHIVKGSSSQKTPLPVELILPDLDQLLERLQAAQSSLDGTQFTFHQSDNNTVAVTDPWGQQFCISSPISGSVLTMGIKEITLPCAPGTAAPIGAFYQQVYKVLRL